MLCSLILPPQDPLLPDHFSSPGAPSAPLCSVIVPPGVEVFVCSYVIGFSHVRVGSPHVPSPSSSLVQEGKPALAADSQGQGAENEAREKLHGAKMKREGQGDTDRTSTPSLLRGILMSKRAWLSLSSSHDTLVHLGNTAAGPHSGPQPSTLNPPAQDPGWSNRSPRWP